MTAPTLGDVKHLITAFWVVVAAVSGAAVIYLTVSDTGTGHAPMAASTLATSSGPEAPEVPSPDDSDYFDVAMATAILTEPDAGPRGRTTRWDRPVITFSVQVPDDYPAEMVAAIYDAIAWASDATGVVVQEVGSFGDMTITGHMRSGGHAEATALSDGQIVSARVEVGCCRPRVAYEEVGQAMGAFGDRGDERSIFSQSRHDNVASDFDTWVLDALYAVPTGSLPEAVAAALETLVP